MNIYEARFKNAIRWAEKINSLLDLGYKIFNNDGESVVNKFVITDTSVYYPWDDNCRLTYFELETYSEEYWKTISEYDKYFNNWTYVNPCDIHTLIKENNND